ncbi:transposase [Nonomuraea deserti]|uniref:transposase n=1 Tax=Nonomuraea deserti TaxID=1848322 RepID=UPI001C6FEC07|nr:transposase [Nonomuraea deserti]
MTDRFAVDHSHALVLVAERAWMLRRWLVRAAARPCGGRLGRGRRAGRGARSRRGRPVTGAGIDVQIVERDPAEAGFVPQPKRWVVEQTYGTMSLHRRLVRDYEHDPGSSESRVYWAMTDAMTRRLTGTFTPPGARRERLGPRRVAAGPDRHPR